MVNIPKRKSKTPKLTKAEIIDKIYTCLNEDGNKLRKCDVFGVIEGFFEQVKTAMTNKVVVELRGFGTFELKLRKGREKARNPRTGAVAPVQAHHVVIFRPGKTLKKSVWLRP